MAIPTAYLTVAGNIKPILEDIQRAGVPPKFTYDFLKQLGHPSSSNRPVIAVLKAIGFLTDSGTPTERYRRYRDSRQAGRALAEGLREAYADLFTIDQEAYTRTTNELRAMFARLSDKGAAVNMKMASTFKTLAELADFKAVPAVEKTAEDSGLAAETAYVEARTEEQPGTEAEPAGAIVVHHDVHVHLPITTDIAVYDAIFRSIRENLR